MSYHAFLRGEDHTEFTIEVEGDSVEDARRQAEDLYPEARILEVYDPQVRSDMAYRRAQRVYDDPDYDDYDY